MLSRNKMRKEKPPKICDFLKAVNCLFNVIYVLAAFSDFSRAPLNRYRSASFPDILKILSPPESYNTPLQENTKSTQNG